MSLEQQKNPFQTKRKDFSTPIYILHLSNKHFTGVLKDTTTATLNI